jgi:putative ABC transport system permease protein
VVGVRKIFMISYADIKKAKGHTVSLLLMFIITSLLLNLGLLVFANFGSYFQNMTKELNSSDVYYIMPSRLYNTEVEEYIKNNENITKMQKTNPLWTTATIPYKGNTKEITFIINDSDANRNLSKWKLVGEHLTPDSMSVYVPYVLSIDGGYKLNDKFEVTFKDNTVITFTIKGFTEDAFFSSLDTGFLGIYLPHDTYEKVVQKLDDKYNATLIFANLEKNNKDVETGIREIIKKQDNSFAMADVTSSLFSLDLQIIKMSRTLMASILSVMMMAFAVIIAAVCLIVVRFRIGNSIEDDMTKIGSLKAMGYTSRQIILSIIMRFVFIATIGSIAGISLSYLTTPAISDVLAHQSGLMWVQGFDSVISVISLFVILLFVVIVSSIASRRIHKLHPIVALRGGIITHSFRKNRLPLHKSAGSLPFVLALKSMLQNVKQSIMMVIIFIAVSFASTFAVVMFYNTTIDTKTFAETPGIEISNAQAVLNANADNRKLVDSISSLNDVRKVQFVDTAMIKVDNYDVPVYIMDDYSKKETNAVYTGRYPLHSNEVVIAGYLADMMEKKLGDSVTLKIGDKQAEFIITGFSQGANMGGLNASIRHDGILKLNPDFKQVSLQIYLNKDVKADEFVKELEDIYGDSIVKTVNMDKEFKQGMGMYTSIISKLGIAILVVTILVIVLVLYFVINSLVTRKKRELGIQKAVGFTTLQLMNQLSLGFLPPIVTGVLIGSILGITQTNAIMSAAQRGMGIMKANYIITPLWIALFGVAVVIFSYIISMFITYRIRKISAYALVSE